VKISYNPVAESALPPMIRCARNCGCTESTIGATADYDDASVERLRVRGWQVVDGAWTCPDHLPEARHDLPGAMGRRRNPHCSNCGDDRGGPYGHEGFECVWQLDTIAQPGTTQAL
jgi:hypothetical protein